MCRRSGNLTTYITLRYTINILYYIRHFCLQFITPVTKHIRCVPLYGTICSYSPSFSYCYLHVHVLQYTDHSRQLQTLLPPPVPPFMIMLPHVPDHSVAVPAAAELLQLSLPNTNVDPAASVQLAANGVYVRAQLQQPSEPFIIDVDINHSGSTTAPAGTTMRNGTEQSGSSDVTIVQMAPPVNPQTIDVSGEDQDATISHELQQAIRVAATSATKEAAMASAS